jgi:hypothetical protein
VRVRSLRISRAAKKRIVREPSATLFNGHGQGAAGQKPLTVTKSLAHRKALAATLRHCYLFEAMTDGELSAVVDAFKKQARGGQRFGARSFTPKPKPKHARSEGNA